MLIPDDVEPSVGEQKIQELEFRASLFESMASGEQLIGGETGRMQIQDHVWLARPGPVTGLVDAAPVAKSTDYFQPITPYEFVTTPRIERNVLHNVITFPGSLLPGGEESLDGYDHLIIADESPLESPTRLEAVRRWMYSGGKLWILLNQVSPSVLEAILGDDFDGSIVDRVSLTHIDMQAAPGRPPIGMEPFKVDTPIELIRMLVDGVDVEITANGWPAAYSKSCGDGRLYVTTLGLDAWVRPRTREDDPPGAGTTWQTSYVPHEALMRWGSLIFEPRSRAKLDVRVLEELARDSIGYSIPSRTLIVGILSVFALALIVAGWWLLRVGEAQRLAIFGPAVAVVVSLMLMGVGRVHRSLPSITSIAQYVQPIPGTTDVRAFGSTAMLVAESGDLALSGESGGWLMPQMAGQEGTTRRLVWSGIDDWKWENVEPPAGVQTASVYSAGRMASQTIASVMFDAEGVSGTLQLPEGLTAGDAVIVTSHGRMAVKFDEDNTFHATSADVLASGQYFSASLLSDQQATRSRVFSALLDGETSDSAATFQPVFYFWTPPWKLGVHYPPSETLTGSALVSVPLSFNRPQAEQILIPSPFLPYKEVMGADGELPQGVYDARQHQWQERSRLSALTLRFQLPAELGSVSLDEARVTVRATGPMEQLIVSGVDQGQYIPIETWTDPAGVLAATWQDPELLQLDEEGGLLLHLQFGSPDESANERMQIDNPTRFGIEALDLELRATVRDASTTETSNIE